MAAADNLTNDELLIRWKSLYERYSTKDSLPSEKSQTLKEILVEIDVHLKLGRISEQCYRHLHAKYTKAYAKLKRFQDIHEPELEQIQNGFNGLERKENKSPNSNVLVIDSNKPTLDVERPENVDSEDAKLPTTTLSTAYITEINQTEKFVDKRDSGLNALIKEAEIENDVEIVEVVDRSEKVVGIDSKICQNSSAAVPSSVNTTMSTSGISFTSKVKAAESSSKEQKSLVSLWASARMKDDSKNSLVSRVEKRKFDSNSPVSKKVPKSAHADSKSAHTDSTPPSLSCEFLTAHDQLKIIQLKQDRSSSSPPQVSMYGNVKKSLGARRGTSSKFMPPLQSRDDAPSASPAFNQNSHSQLQLDERLKTCEPRMIELILSEIMDCGKPMSWDDIAGLDFAKKTIQEIVVWPMLRPDIFTGLRGPPKGLLLFGPPGNGKTLFGKCIASQSKSTFFTISASSLTSKWVGEGEKMVRTLFAVARCHQPAVVFIDEIDSLLTQRSDNEHESSRRIKTEFLVQLDGACTASDERLLVIGATNRPQEIDEAARRRFVKRLYIPLPECNARAQIIKRLVHDQTNELTEDNLQSIAQRADGFSGADMANLCREAALGPIRCIPFGEISNISADDVRPIQFSDFEDALEHVKASVSQEDLDVYLDWNNRFGSGRR